MISVLRKHDPDSPAILDASSARVISYGELCERVDRASAQLRKLPGRPLIFLYADNSPEAIVAYLGCIAARVPVCLLDADASVAMDALIESYAKPHLLLPAKVSTPKDYAKTSSIEGSAFQLACFSESNEYGAKIHPDLALLLQTSGSTGNPKLVRLSWANAEANARSIVAYLGIAPGQRSMQSLPMSYSYGLSLVNSHLLAGATIVLSPHSFLRPEFWQDFDKHQCTAFAGVPFMYETLEKIRFRPAAHPSLKTMTQAGGALRPEIARSFHQKARESGARFFVMYGQTEATARISFVPPERLEQKLGSIGLPIPGGRWELVEAAEAPGKEELVYFGPNVMMGYAENASSLLLGDELRGRLATGDLARLDEEGYAYIEGRLKRIAKIFGLRLNLEDVERRLETVFPVRAAAVEGESAVRVYLEADGALEIPKVTSYLASWLGLPPTAFALERIDALPRNASGKKDYGRLLSR